MLASALLGMGKLEGAVTLEDLAPPPNSEWTFNDPPLEGHAESDGAMVLSSAGNHMLWVPNQRLVRKSPLVLPARNPSSVFEEEHNDDVDYTDVSFGMWVGHIPSHLHPTCTLPRHLIPSHPYHPSLSRGKDLDPTSRWVLALLRES